MKKVSKRFFNNSKRREEVIALVDANINKFAEEIAEELKDFENDDLEGTALSMLSDKILNLMSKHFAETLGGSKYDYDFGHFVEEIFGTYRKWYDDMYESTFRFDFLKKYGQMVLDAVNAKRAQTEESGDDLITIISKNGKMVLRYDDKHKAFIVPTEMKDFWDEL